jgi:glycoside/pentoside/hexuronide:cation symporter, GPH family
MAGQLNTVSQNYFYIYSMNREDLISVMSMAALIPMVVGLIVLPDLLLRKVGKKRMLYIGSGTHVVTMVLIGIASTLGNIPLIIVLTVIKSFAVGATSIPIGILPADAIDYGEYLSNKRIEGMGNAVITFAQKVATGLAAGILGWVLQLTGYVANQAQNGGTILGINILFCYAPALLYAIVFVCYKLFYHYDEEEPMVLAELARRKEEVKCEN